MAEVFYAMHKREEERCIESSAKAQTEPVGLIGPSAAPEIPGPPRHPALGLGKCGMSTQPCTQFQLGDELQIQTPADKIPLADSLYSRVVDIWAAHLGDIVRSLTYRPVLPEGIGAVVAEITQENKKTLGRCYMKLFFIITFSYKVHNLGIPRHGNDQCLFFGILVIFLEEESILN